MHSFFADGALPPWELPREAARRGLDAIALTNHGQVWAAKLGRWFSARIGGPTILVGQEITAPSYPLIAAGIEETVRWDQPAARAIEEVHRQGGVAIAAHPLAEYWPGFEGTLDALDGSERMHPLVFVDREGARELLAFYERGRSPNRPRAAVGSSDHHVGADLGLCRTYVFARQDTPEAILEALRAGRTVVYDRTGTPHGDPALLALLEDRPLEGVGGPKPAGVAGICGWLGLAGLVVCGRPGPLSDSRPPVAPWAS
ncbi:MAG: PHP-associated domain-containing protein [Planctomycetota bacterium]